MQPYLVSVGKVHPGWGTLGPQLSEDMLEYNFRGGAHEIMLALQRPREEEVRAIRNHPVRFALVEKGNLILLLHKFGRLPWGESGFSIHRVPPADRQLPRLTEEEEHALLTVTLIDRANGRVVALRALTFSAHFTRVLHEAIHRQHALPYDRYSYEAAVRGLHDAYPRTEDLLPEAIARCEGGS
jgi:hypothetical protein